MSGNSNTVTLEDVKKEVKSTVAEAVKELLPNKEDGEKALNEKIDNAIDEKMKKVDLKSLMVNFLPKAEKELKLFDPISGKLVEVRKVDDKYAEANRMLRCILAGDQATAIKISDEIHADNDRIRAKKMESLGIKAPTPTVSDTTTRGGYAIPTEVSSEIMQLIYGESVMYQNANKNTIIYESMVYPVMYGIEMAYIADQSTAATEKNPTFYNPTISMKRMGAFSAISNKIIRQKGADLVSAFKIAYSSAAAEFLDLHIACGNVTGSGDLIDGIMFSSNMVLDTERALSAFVIDHMETMVSSINAKVNQGSLRWVCNRLMKQYIGHLADAAGRPLFPNYYSGGDFQPLGIPLVLNRQIPSTLNVGSDAREGGTDNALMLVDFSKVVAALSDDIMIDMSKDFYFTSDLTALRGIQDVGWALLFGNTQASGGVARTLALTA